MLFQVLCGFEPVFYTTHPNEEPQIVMKTQDLTYLKWSHIRSSSGTAGTFLKSESSINGKKIYYKLSNFDPVNGVIGHECVNEIIVDRLLTLLGVMIFDGLETILSEAFRDKIWNMIYKRYKIYENL